MNICQVVGYKNSGKTTLMARLIEFFSKEGIRVASLKHHGHGGEPAIVEGTDSHRHVSAGAAISGVQGETVSQFTCSTDCNLEQLIEVYRYLNVEFLFLEGYKRENYPKIVMVRKQSDLADLESLSNIIAVVSWNKKIKVETLKVPVFHLDELSTEIEQLADCIRR